MGTVSLILGARGTGKSRQLAEIMAEILRTQTKNIVILNKMTEATRILERVKLVMAEQGDVVDWKDRVQIGHEYLANASLNTIFVKDDGSMEDLNNEFLHDGYLVVADDRYVNMVQFEVEQREP